MSIENHHILIVDDQPSFHRTTRIGLAQNYDFDGAITVAQMWEKLEEKSFDLLLLDLKLDETEELIGLKLIPEIKERFLDLPIVTITADERYETWEQAHDLGAEFCVHKGQFDYKFCDRFFRKIIERYKKEESLKQIKVKYQKLIDKLGKFEFVGQSPKIEEIKDMLRTVSEVPDVTVLLTGETGVGKEVAAKYLHQYGERKTKPFEAIHLSTVSETLLESRLFGHKKGSFTDAKADQKGVFEKANGGVLFLDEIGEINADLQVKLLRFLETKVITPIGGENKTLDVQIVAATNRNLREEVNERRFREDLFQRLKNMVITIPPLRERKEDIPLLLKHFLETKYGLSITDLTKDVQQKLQTYNWIGNVRELSNAVDAMVLQRRIRKKEKIDVECLPEDIRSQQLKTNGSVASTPTSIAVPELNLSPKEESVWFKLQQIEQALKAHKTKEIAAEKSGFSHAEALKYFVKTRYKKHPHLFDTEHFPTIIREYDYIIQ